MLAVEIATNGKVATVMTVQMQVRTEALKIAAKQQIGIRNPDDANVRCIDVGRVDMESRFCGVSPL